MVTANTLVKKWPYLGGKLHRNGKTGKLELLVPESEIAELEVLVQERDQSIKDLQPSYTTTSSISVQQLGTDISLFLRKDRNITVDEYVQNDVPAFHINITVLRDATTFAFTHPHLLMDAGGFNLFMTAFFAVIRGEEVGPLLLDDPFTPFFATPSEEKDDYSPPGWTLYGPPEFDAYAKHAQDDEEQEGVLERRIIYFPKSEIERLKIESLQELHGEGNVDVTFLSSGDIILAWVYKHFYGGSKHDLDRLTRAVTVADIR
ncbi:hypothetical protein HYPSUDRAFT_1059892 [Hypholoma sublateritium FD-334 SS-4]|uniref:Condensation domain-containing protein n=1 Tax=Hypholoma sublateritium (strain FD-334 SS-4) TaxID=945553 RepID=A0A0D2NJJ9_HYPSF|nr:hypothetical protein HYPSUDRAFT_1059892 [Hypholoma sublateritium FD-334 SS-4]